MFFVGLGPSHHSSREIYSCRTAAESSFKHKYSREAAIGLTKLPGSGGDTQGPESKEHTSGPDCNRS